MGGSTNPPAGEYPSGHFMADDEGVMKTILRTLRRSVPAWAALIALVLAAGAHWKPPG